METIENIIDKTIDEILKPDEIIFHLIESKINDAGINLTSRQKNQLKEQLNKNIADNLQFDLNWWQERKIRKLPERKLIINLDDVDIRLLNDEIQLAIETTVRTTLNDISESLITSWKSQSKSLLKLQQKQRDKFTSIIYKKWGKPLDLLEILLSVSLDTGLEFNRYYRPLAVKERDFIFEALVKLHARGCQVGSEALLLLRNGFADGAHARWRTLHEMSVDALYISQNGITVAEKFLLHYIVSNYKIFKEYQKHCNNIGYEPLSQEEIDSLEFQRNEVLNRFGKNFNFDYGWATTSTSDRAPTFEELEKSVGLDYMRPFYKLANINVHSGSKGANFRLGLPPDDSELLVAGPSIYGLGEAGQNLAYSYFLLTSTLLRTRENLDQLTLVSTLQQLMNETIWAFDEVMERKLGR